MKVALIGANGFVGTRLLERWSLRNTYEVRPIVRKPASLAAIARFDIEWKFGDALDETSLTTALEGCDAVVHAAIGDPKQIEQMPTILVNAAKAANVGKIVYLSSASVHGQNPNPGDDESSPLSEKQAIEYNNAKVRAETAFFAALTNTGIRGCALRPGVVFGPRSRWITDIADDFLAGTTYFINNGSGICNSIYIDNLAKAIELALDHENLPAASYLLNDRESVTWRDFYDPIGKAVGKSIDNTPTISTPAFPKSLKQKTNSMVSTRLAQSLLPLIPYKLKRIVKSSINAWPENKSGGAWRYQETAKPAPTEEMCELQACRYKFPYDKAAKEIGYSPEVSFDEGMRRSLAWLAFAGYPIEK